ncbi:protein RETICULATA-RELATED 4, chloroplastic isoform X2 [Sorghum bicolor]|uniref:protein RETICULATA-RELATED 4, chloroplastic isoform X2 n=1 Tax=Sorghum bicolor TaxID=4558 RepID=UPI000B423B5E|nr:protein RETICULATA-RELATED 4, chloroplastic isoform X2 [Sorghum bicolor]|eukprot:XP_021303452.1 protein RETICULATA-RELATED 4, chloroplastic isoform X2 [Sorghum bicolor]
MASPRPTSLSSPAALIHLRLQPLPSIPPLHPTTLPFPRSLPLHLPSLRLNGPHLPPLPLASSGSGSAITGTGGEADLPPLPLDSSDSGSGITGTGGEDGLPPSGGGGGGGGGDGEGEGEGDGEGSDDASVNRREALFVLAQLGRKLESLPADLAAAVEGGRIPAEIVRRFVDLEASPVFRWLLQFGGFKERLLADDLFLTKVAIECGVGIFTKVMAIVADFMLVWLPAPTVSLQPPLAVNSGAIAKFFYNCPDNAFQVALSGTSYSLLQRAGAILRNGAKLFAVGTSASLVGTGVTNALIKARQAASKDFDGEVENLPIVSTSVAYGVYMAVSSNLRYQVLAGVIEQRMLEPLLHQHKLVLSAASFAVRTGNTFLGSLLWIDYARWVGVQ